MSKRTIVLSGASGRADGLIRVDGKLAQVSTAVKVDSCIIRDGQTFKGYKVEGGRFVTETERDWSRCECLLYQGGKAVLYGVTGAKGSMDEMVRAVERERDIRRAKKEAKHRDQAALEKVAEPIKKVEEISDPFAPKKRDERINVVAMGTVEKPEFYYSVKPALDEMFVCYPEENALVELIPDSRWVRVTCGENSCYVVGLMRIDGEVKYICYGIPSGKDLTPPDELKDVCEWIPKRGADDGYWMVFQDAVTGETLSRIA